MKKREKKKGREARASDVFADERRYRAGTLPSQNFIDDEIRNRRDLPPCYARAHASYTFNYI